MFQRGPLSACILMGSIKRCCSQRLHGCTTRNHVLKDQLSVNVQVHRGVFLEEISSQNSLRLKWYYDQKKNFVFPLDFKTMLTKH